MLRPSDRKPKGPPSGALRGAGGGGAPFEPVTFGRYRLVERIALGGMAEIFKAKVFGAHGFERTLVVKRILPQLAQDAEFVRMFIDEAKVMGQLNHPKIVQVLDFGEVNGQYYIAMEHVDGIDGLALLRLCADRRCRPTTAVAVHVISEVLDALDYSHALKDEQGVPLGIVHRDITPSNIFISTRGDVKLGDFGIARAALREENTQVGVLKGKYGYMSPEQVSGDIVDHRADVFSAGVVLAELLIIRRLFTARNELDILLQVRDAQLDRLSRYGERIPKDLRAILEAALSRDPALRYQNAADFRDALLRYLYDNRRMVSNGHVRRFLDRLGDDQAMVTGADDDGGAVEIPALGEGRVRSDFASSSMDLTKTSMEEELFKKAAAETRQVDVPPELEGTTGVERPREVGKKRRIVLAPPPSAQPLPGELPVMQESGRSQTDDRLAAVADPRRSLDSLPDFDDLQDLVEAPALPEIHELPPVPAAEQVAARLAATGLPQTSSDQHGDLERQSLFKVIFRLAVKEETGLLLLKQGEAQKKIFVVDGHPRSISSNQAEELFGQYMVRKGVISDGELSMALAMLPHFQGRLGDTLVSLKLVTPVEMLRHLTFQVRQKLLDTFTWTTGTFEYYAGRRNTEEFAPLGLDAFELLGAAIHSIALEVLVERLQPLMGVPLRPASLTPVPPEVFRLGPLPAQLRQRFDGRLTVGEVLGRFTEVVQKQTATRLVYLLTETGLLVP